MTSSSSTDLLGVALDQVGDLLGRVDADHLDSSTPCTEWSVSDLVDHLVQSPANLTAMMRGEQPDWSAPTPHVGEDRADRFREHADALRAAWDGQDGDAQGGSADWQLAELAVHTWDLATALGEPTSTLDAEVAERGLAFMRGGLTDDNRSPVFAPEQEAPADADAYGRIAAFAGRSV